MDMSTVSFPGLGFAINLKEIAFHVFGWPIHWYGIIIAAGFLLAVLYCSHKARSYGITQDNLIDMLIFAVPIAIICARIYYVIFYLDLYRRADGSYDILEMFRIWDGGLAIYGGIIGAVLTVFIFSRIKKISFLAFADLGCFGLLIGQCVGRWGNFVNVEAYGAATTLPWRMGIYDTVNGVFQYMEVHPTFLYESLWNLAGFLLLAFVIARHRKFDGQIFLSYIGWYGLGRAWIEGLRTDSLYFFSTGLRVSQVLAIASFAAAAILLVICFARHPDPKDLWVNRLAARQAPAAEEKQAAPEAERPEAPQEEKKEETDSHDPT